MKKLLVIFTVLIIVFTTSCDTVRQKSSVEGSESTTSETQNKEISAAQKMTAVWLTCYEIGDMAAGKTSEEYTAEVNALLTNLKAAKINTVFFHVRAFSDALYNSELFPQSKYLSLEDRSGVDYDVLSVFIECAKKCDIKVHAWINPFRVSYSNKIDDLPESSPAKKMYDKSSKTTSLIICDKGIYYNPADDTARALILSGVREILENYKVDGIQFDDYFYPAESELGDGALYKTYKSAGGTLSGSDWRRENVSGFISSVYSLVKSFDEKLVFGVSPSANIKYDTEEIYADVCRWCSVDGYIDYVIPQIYYGFQNEKLAFSDVMTEWENTVSADSVSLYCGLAAYKCGRKDENAGSGCDEWLNSNDILKRQYAELSCSGKWYGAAFFSYSYLFGENVNEISEKEIRNIIDVIK